MGICEAPERPEAVLDVAAEIIDAETMATADGHAQAGAGSVDVNGHVEEATAAGAGRQQSHVEEEPVPTRSENEVKQDPALRTTDTKRLDELDPVQPSTDSDVAEDVREVAPLNDLGNNEVKETAELPNNADAQSEDTKKGQFEITPLKDWPKLVDPKSLYTDYDRGMPDTPAVRAYLEQAFAVMGRVDNEPKGPSPLKEMGLTSNIQTVELNEGEPFQPSQEALDRWKRDHPIDFAVMAMIGEELTETAEPSLAPVSPVLEADPNADLDLQTELRRYLQWTNDNRPATARFIADALQFMDPPRTNVNDLQCIVAVPVAGHQEHGNIFHTLEQYSRGKMPHEKYEIALHLNLPGGDSDKDAELADELRKTLHEVQMFKERYPTVNVRSFVNTYRGTPPPIGHIRADQWDTIALDMHQRGREKDILIISGDADLTGANDEFLDEMAETFEETGADIVTPGFAWAPIPGLPYNATANKILRYHTFLYDTYDKNSAYSLTSDAATGVSLATYLATGGFDRHTRLGEMNSLVRGIRYYRQGVTDREQPGYQPVKTVEARARGARLKSSSRRVVETMAKGFSPEHTWDPKVIEFGADDKLRTEAMQIEAAERNAQRKWRSWLREMTPGYVGSLPEDKRHRVLRAARHILGFSDFRQHTSTFMPVSKIG